MGLIDNHRIAAFRQRSDLVEDVRELLQRRGDDARLLAGQRLSELRGGFLDALHHAHRMLELADRVLQLAVEHEPVGDHYDLVEHPDVVCGLQ